MFQIRFTKKERVAVCQYSSVVSLICQLAVSSRNGGLLLSVFLTALQAHCWAYFLSCSFDDDNVVRFLFALSRIRIYLFVLSCDKFSNFRSTSGEMDRTIIANEIVKMNQNRVRISTLGFGSLANMKMLNQIAGLNGGSSRRVFEELDAAEQVK